MLYVLNDNNIIQISTINGFICIVISFLAQKATMYGEWFCVILQNCRKNCQKSFIFACESISLLKAFSWLIHFFFNFESSSSRSYNLSWVSGCYHPNWNSPFTYSISVIFVSVPCTFPIQKSRVSPKKCRNVSNCCNSFKVGTRNKSRLSFEILRKSSCWWALIF